MFGQIWSEARKTRVENTTETITFITPNLLKTRFEIIATFENCVQSPPDGRNLFHGIEVGGGRGTRNQGAPGKLSRNADKKESLVGTVIHCV
jgi:hypothetical protein